jgi:hypothetical protein
MSADVGDACREALAHALLETLQERGREVVRDR